MKTLLTATAVIEAGAGLALLGVPSVTASLLLGTPLEASAAMILARVGGAAILALAIVCWLTRDANGLVSRGLVVAMTFYNVTVAAVLAVAGLGHRLHGMLLWPAASSLSTPVASLTPATPTQIRRRFLLRRQLQTAVP